MSRLIHFVLALVFVTTLGGCATTKSLPEGARSEIDAVSIAAAVTFPPPREHTAGLVKLTVGAPNPSFIGGLFGRFLTPGASSVGDAILASGERDENKQYAMFLQATGIDVAPIVRGEFEAQLRQHPFFGPRLAQAAQYRFELDVPHYTLVQTHEFSGYYKVSIVVRARLVGPGGEVLAEGRGSSCLFRDCFAPDKLRDILDRPELLRQQYVLAARDAIQSLLKSL